MSSFISNPTIQPLQGMADYYYWAKQMEILLSLEHVEQVTWDSRWKPHEQQQKKGLLLIYTNVSESIRRFLIDLECDDAHAAWHLLEARYSVKAGTNIESFKRLLYLEQKDFDDEEGYLEQLKQCLMDLQRISMEEKKACFAEIGRRCSKASLHVEGPRGRDISNLGREMCINLLIEKRKQILHMADAGDQGIYSTAQRISDMLVHFINH